MHGVGMVEVLGLPIPSVSTEASLLLPEEMMSVEDFHPGPGAIRHHSRLSLHNIWGSVKEEFLPLPSMLIITGDLEGRPNFHPLPGVTRNLCLSTLMMAQWCQWKPGGEPGFLPPWQ